MNYDFYSTLVWGYNRNIMFDFGKKHRRGKITFFYLLISKSWWLVLISIGSIYLSWLMYFGALQGYTTSFLAGHPDWYITVSMLSSWILLFGICVMFLAYFRTNALHRMYKFILDDHAVHLHRGLFFIREITIPYQQISNVHIIRPYHFRLLGLAQLDIVTAADTSTDRVREKAEKFLIPIIDVSIARVLSRQLLESASKVRNGKEVYPEDFDDDSDEDDDELDDRGED